jgi:uncharacterized protein (DUF58 family)
MLPSPRLIIMVMAAAPLFLAGTLYDVFVGIGTIYVILLTLFIIFDALILPRQRKILIRRITPNRVSLGSPVRIIFEVQNNCRRKVELCLAEDAPSTIDVEPKICRAILESGESTSLEYRLVARRRGRHELSFIDVRILPAMGLLFRQFRVKIPVVLHVFPNLMNLKRYELLTRRGLSYEQGLAKLKMIGQGSEFESLRHYVSGDEMSRIEWKASAKRTKLIVKNYQPERQQSIIVAIDVGRATAGEFGGLSRVDYLVNATLMLAFVALRQNDWFSMVAFSDRIESYLPPVNGIKNIDRVARALFELQPRLVESDYGAACRFLGLKNRKRSLLCMMTDVVDSDASNVIIAYMSRFARYHLPLAITLSNPEVSHVAEESLAECEDLYSKAVALDTLTAREKALLVMRQKGISVLDVPPAHLTPELINRYTMIKSMHRL